VQILELIIYMAGLTYQRWILKVDLTNLSDFLTVSEKFRKFIIAASKLMIINKWTKSLE
jgi:hypothetical protein